MAWRVARSLDVLLRQLNERYPNRSKASDGSIGDQAHKVSKSEHNPDHLGIVRARDFTHDPAAGCDIDRLSDELAASRDPRIRYIIANGLILFGEGQQQRPWQWFAYHGSSPHTKHLHLSVVADARADDARPWDLPCFRTEEDDMPSAQEIWDHLIPDPYPNAQPKRARDLLGWAATHAAYARAEAAGARAAIAELAKQVDAGDNEIDVDALVSRLEDATRAVLAEGVLDVEVSVRDKTTTA